MHRRRIAFGLLGLGLAGCQGETAEDPAHEGDAHVVVYDGAPDTAPSDGGPGPGDGAGPDVLADGTGSDGGCVGTGCTPPAVPCVASTTGKDYPVGPGKTYATLGDVPWETLNAGDTVRIHWQASAYKEKFVINRSGTAAQPIRICGVPGPAGERPIIDGKDATTRKGQLFRSTGEGSAIDMQNYALILLDGTSYDAPRPEYITIDGLSIKGANSTNAFKATDGSARTYVEGVSCIRVQKGAHVIIRNNEVADCDNGLFSQTSEDWNDATKTPHESTVTRDISIDGNYIHGHGKVGSDRYHDSYIQSVGALYQYNHYGPQRPGAGGSALKDRSIGTVVRFNRVDGCARALDLVEAENNPHMAILDPAYRTTFVYGNVIRHDASVGVAIHYGGDHYGGELWTLDNQPWPPSAYGESFFRKGTLYFFHNTVVIDAAGEYGSSIFQVSTTEEHAEILDNVFWTNGNPAYVGLRSGTGDINKAHWTAGGTVDLGVNVFNKGWMDSPDPDHLCPGPLTGAGKMLTTPTSSVDLTTYQLVTGAVGRDVAVPTSTVAALGPYPVDREYTDDLLGRPRVVVGTGADLGALEGK